MLQQYVGGNGDDDYDDGYDDGYDDDVDDGGIDDIDDDGSSCGILYHVQRDYIKVLVKENTNYITTTTIRVG